MKKYLCRIISIALVLSMITVFSGCNNGSETPAKENIETIEIPKAEKTPAEKPDIGEHKDYDKQDAECYYSGTLLIAKQDNKPRAMELFTMEVGEGCLEFYANEMNKIKEEAGRKVNVYSMIVPTASELYCPPKYQTEIDDQTTIIENAYDMLMDVKPINVLETLKTHNAENIYYRSDSRWTPLGAYYAGKVFAKAAGVDYPDISEYTASAQKEYIGDFANMCDASGYEDLSKFPDEFIYYKPSDSFTTNYYNDEFEFLTVDKYYEENKEALYDGYYKGGFYNLRLDTKVKNNRKLLIVKDDFGTVLPSFLTSSFSQIYVTSIRYLTANLSEIISEFGVTDVLYVLSTYTVTGQEVYTLETLRTQATNGTLKDGAPYTDISESSSDSDSNTDTDLLSEESAPTEPEYIYGVGINNQIGIVEPSEPEENTPTEDTNDGLSDEGLGNEENYTEEYNDDGNDQDADNVENYYGE